MNFVLAMLARNFAVERRSLRTGFLRMALQPAVYIFVFGYVVGRMLPGGNSCIARPDGFTHINLFLFGIFY